MTVENELTVSVIVPTHNRCASLRRTLDTLCAQTFSSQRMELIVVADGCADGTVEMLHYYRAPFTLHIVEQPGQGAARARNHGVARASGRMFLFLDDDIEATPSLIERHVHAHQLWPGHVVIGACPPVFEGGTGFFQMGLRQWWEDHFRAMRQSDHRYTYRDLLTGNLSLEAELFARVGGFNPALQCREDYEFGLCLMTADVPFVFAADALGYHHETSDLDRSFQRIRQEGRADVQISRRYPELRSSLPLAHLEAPCSRLGYVLRMFAFKQPRAGDALAARLRRALDLLEWARVRGRWQRLYRQLRDYWYWRGVAGQVGSRQALASFLQGGPIRPEDEGLEIELDLRQGLEAAEQRLNEERPTALRICYGQQPVGHVPPQPGAERLRGVHLRRILATELFWPLLIALAMEGALNSASETDQRLAMSRMQPLEAIGPSFLEG